MGAMGQDKGSTQAYMEDLRPEMFDTEVWEGGKLPRKVSTMGSRVSRTVSFDTPDMHMSKPQEVKVTAHDLREAVDYEQQLLQASLYQQKLEGSNAQLLKRMNDMEKVIKQLEEERNVQFHQKERLAAKTRSLEDRLQSAEQLQLETAQKRLQQEEEMFQNLQQVMERNEQLEQAARSSSFKTSTQLGGIVPETPGFGVSPVVPESGRAQGELVMAGRNRPTQESSGPKEGRQRRRLPQVPRPEILTSDSEEEDREYGARQRGPYIKLKPFQGRSEENWFSWVQLFEENIRLADIRGDNQIILRFASSLERTAAEFFHELSPEIRRNWKACKKAFTEEYSGEHNAVNAKIEWARICMKPGENARDYYNRFIKTYRRAHPGKRIGEWADEHIERFLRGIPEKLQDEVVDDGPQTLGEARDMLQNRMCKSAQKKCLRMNAPPMINQVQVQADGLMFGLYNEPHERTQTVETVQTVLKEPTRGAQAAPEDNTNLLTTLVSLMKAMQSPGKDKQEKRKFGKPLHKTGDKVESIPRGLRKFRLVSDPVWGQCWYCGEMGSNHRVFDCPTRQKDERDRPGSSLINQENQ